MLPFSISLMMDMIFRDTITEQAISFLRRKLMIKKEQETGHNTK